MRTFHGYLKPMPQAALVPPNTKLFHTQHAGRMQRTLLLLSTNACQANSGLLVVQERQKEETARSVRTTQNLVQRSFRLSRQRDTKKVLQTRMQSRPVVQEACL